MRVLIYFISLVCLIPTAWSENMFDAQSGELIIPVLEISASEAYSVRFSLFSEEPLIWQLDSFESSSPGARTAASYDAENNLLSVPEINVLGTLYDLDFALTENCDASACLEPQVESLLNRGQEGASVFTSPLSNASTYSCASCHAIHEADGLAMDGFRRPGHPLLNASKRASFKNGQYSEMLDAVNTCLTEFMNTGKWTAQSQQWLNLLNWIEDQDTQEPAVEVERLIVDSPAELSGGSVENGRELFNSRCIVCHGFDGGGTPLGPKITGTGLQADYIANRVRWSGPVTSGVMPFWGANRLGDGELIDIIAYVVNSEEIVVEMGEDDPPPVSDNSCSANSGKIGQSATLSSLFHSVGGIATIIDDCTIEITNFTFDGGGIDVQIYGGSNGNFHPAAGGFSLSQNLVGIAYSGNSLTLTLPNDKTIDDFDSISVWCVAVGVSFGTAFFSN